MSQDTNIVYTGKTNINLSAQTEPAPEQESLLSTISRNVFYLVPVIGTYTSFKDLEDIEAKLDSKPSFPLFRTFFLNLGLSTLREVAVIALAIAGIATSIFASINPLVAVPLFLFSATTLVVSSFFLLKIAKKILMRSIIIFIDQCIPLQKGNIPITAAARRMAKAQNV